MLRQGSSTEQLLGQKIQMLLRKDAQKYNRSAYQFCSNNPPSLLPFEVRDIGSQVVFLAKGDDGEIFEVQITGNIDPGAWEVE